MEEAVVTTLGHHWQARMINDKTMQAKVAPMMILIPVIQGEGGLSPNMTKSPGGIAILCRL